MGGESTIGCPRVVETSRLSTGWPTVVPPGAVESEKTCGADHLWSARPGDQVLFEIEIASSWSVTDSRPCASFSESSSVSSCL